MNKKALITMTLVTVSVISQAATNNAAQTRCTLTEATAPNIRGLKLGMTVDELLALFPGIAKKTEMKSLIEQAKVTSATDVAYLGFDSTDGDAQRFDGIDSVSAGVYKSRVVDLSVQYVGATWDNVDDWIAKLSQSLRLPGAQRWTKGQSEAPSKVLKCDGIVIEAAIMAGGSAIRLRSTAHDQDLADRSKAAEEKKRQATKP